MKNMVMVFFVVNVLLITARNSYSAVIYDNGPSLWSGAVNIVRWVVADDFTLQQDASITGATVDLWFNSELFSSHEIEWWIFDDNMGDPGNIISTGIGQNSMPTYVGIHPSGNTHFWKLYFNFGSEIKLVANTTYWFAIRLSDTSKDVSWSNTIASGYNDTRSLGGTFDNWEHSSASLSNCAFTLHQFPVLKPVSISGTVSLLLLKAK